MEKNIAAPKSTEANINIITDNVIYQEYLKIDSIIII